MRAIKKIGLIVAVLGLITAIVALITEGIKLYRELPTPTAVATPADFSPNDTSAPTSLPNPSPQSTSEPIQLGKTLFVDDFESGSADKFRNMIGLWRVVKDETGNWVYEIDNKGKKMTGHPQCLIHRLGKIT